MGDKGDRTKQSILEEAFKLFAKYGYKSVTMQQICDATGLSRGGLYRHYNKIEEIFEEVLNQLGRNQKELFSSQIQQGISAKKIINEVLERMEVEMQDGTTSLNYAIYEFSKESNNEYMQKANKQATEYWTELLEYGVTQGEFNCMNIHEVVDLILYSYQGVRMWSQIIQMDKNVSKNVVNCIRRLVGVEYESRN